MNAVLVNKERAADSGVTTTAGNHGAALAWAASQVGAKAFIIMPSNAPKSKIAAVKHYGGCTFVNPILKLGKTTSKVKKKLEYISFIPI